MSLVDALAADRAGDVELAAARYEELLAAGDASLIVFLNLALLYWQATDPGLAAAKKLTPNFLAIAGRRIPELLDEAQRRFPHSTEIRFWKRYIAWADLEEKLDSAYCRQLLQEDPTTLAPALSLFSASDGDEAMIEARELLKACHLSGTTGARYTASVIESVLKSKKWRSKLEQVYVALLDEGVDVWRPVEAECLHEDIYLIVGQPCDRESETWQFKPGDKVRCKRIDSSDGRILAAVEKA